MINGNIYALEVQEAWLSYKLIHCCVIVVGSQTSEHKNEDSTQVPINQQALPTLGQCEPGV